MAVRAIFAALLTWTALAGGAFAQGGNCGWLQSQYLSAIRDSGSAAQLASRLAQAQAAASRMNCGGGNLFELLFGPPPQCAGVMNDIHHLQSDLGRLQSGGAIDPDLPGLRQQLQANGCDIPVPSLRAARTICVRSCDGYYFPMNFSSPRGRWKVDAEACQSMQGAAGQAELYVYDPEGDVADALSLTGKRYGDQPFAFRYRQTYDAACAAQLHDGIAALAARYLAARKTRPQASPGGASLAVSQVRPVEGEQPETLDQAAGQSTPSSQAWAPRTDVRVVGGPSYLADLHTLPRPLGRRYSWFTFSPAVGEAPPDQMAEAR